MFRELLDFLQVVPQVFRQLPLGYLIDLRRESVRKPPQLLRLRINLIDVDLPRASIHRRLNGLVCQRIACRDASWPAVAHRLGYRSARKEQDEKQTRNK